MATREGEMLRHLSDLVIMNRDLPLRWFEPTHPKLKVTLGEDSLVSTRSSDQCLRGHSPGTLREHHGGDGSNGRLAADGCKRERDRAQGAGGDGIAASVCRSAEPAALGRCSSPVARLLSLRAPVCPAAHSRPFE